MKISEQTLADIRDKVEIADVVSEYIDLKKSGKDLVGCCPFHEDKTPSLSVSTDRQLFYCFGCGTGGDAIKFLRDITGESFTETILGLANRYNIQIEEVTPEAQERWQKTKSRQDQLREILAQATYFYEYVLRRPAGQPALNYLHSRIADEAIARFQLGFAPNTWDGILNYLTKKGWSVELIEAAGLILPRKEGSGYYDRFRGRVMIPIKDEQGRVIGFGGRALGDEKPKYLNSPQTELFDKSASLFGLDLARKEIVAKDEAIVVEGYFDVIALHSHGFGNAVATLGTALSETQIKQILRFTKSNRVVLGFDADTAGTKATDRALGTIGDLARQGNARPHILTLPSGKDADEYLRHHPAQSLANLIQSSPSWLEWQAVQIGSRHDVKSADGYQNAVKDAIAFLNRINEADRVYYLGFVAEVLSGGVHSRIQAIESALAAKLNPIQVAQTSAITQPIAATNPVRHNAEFIVMLFWLYRPDLRPQIFGYVNHLESLIPNPLETYGELWNALQSEEIEPSEVVGWVRTRYEDDPLIAPLLSPSEKAAQDIPCSRLLSGAILTIEQQIREGAINQVLDQVTEALKTQNRDYVSQALAWVQQQRQYTRQLDQLRRDRQPR